MIVFYLRTVDIWWIYICTVDTHLHIARHIHLDRCIMVDIHLHIANAAYDYLQKYVL